MKTRFRPKFTLMILTSENHSEDIARCQELAIAGYLIKPVGRTGLFQAIFGELNLVRPNEPVHSEIH